MIKIGTGDEAVENLNNIGGVVSTNSKVAPLNGMYASYKPSRSPLRGYMAFDNGG